MSSSLSPSPALFIESLQASIIFSSFTNFIHCSYSHSKIVASLPEISRTVVCPSFNFKLPRPLLKRNAFFHTEFVTTRKRLYFSLTIVIFIVRLSWEFQLHPSNIVNRPPSNIVNALKDEKLLMNWIYSETGTVLFWIWVDSQTGAILDYMKQIQALMKQGNHYERTTNSFRCSI